MAKIIISLPNELLVDADKYCKIFKYNRSEWIRSLMRDKLKQQGLDVSQPNAEPIS